MSKFHRNQRGFTLVELLIVVIILGILAAVVIPQFNNAASESKESALASNLATIRQAIEMYKVQHDDNFPTASILDQLTNSTDRYGNTAGSEYGPYIRNSFPKNPLYGGAGASDAITVVATMPGGATNASGWIYATDDGEFRANDGSVAASGTNTWDL